MSDETIQEEELSEDERTERQAREAKKLSETIMLNLKGIAEQIRKYERIVASGQDHNGNALANLRYYQRTINGVKAHNIKNSSNY
jgi:hypothetical protein